NPDLTVGTIMQREQAFLAALPDDLPARVLVLDGPPLAPELIQLNAGAVASSQTLDASGPGALRSALPPALASAATGGDEGEANAPSAVVVSPSLALEREAAGVLAGELEVLAVPRALTEGLPGWEAGDTSGAFTVPGLASLGALRQLARGGQLRAVPMGAVTAPCSKLPPPKLLAAAGLGLALLLSLFALGGDDTPKQQKYKRKQQGPAVAAAKSAPTGAAQAADHDREAAADLAAGVSAAGSASPGVASEEQGLGRRMAASRALAEACNRVVDGVVLERILVDRMNGMLIEGVVEADSRLGGLRALADYRTSLLQMAFVGSMTESIEYHDLESGAEELGFLLSASWTGKAAP
ncbi:MAG: hypothetical protein DRQ55_17190, partial [Planctomycetota bacterium]